MYEELVDEKSQALIDKHIAFVGIPCAGSTSDVWSLASCRESFSCLRGSFVFDGDTVAEVTGDASYRGMLVDFSPILGFERFTESRHTGAALARSKAAIFKAWNLVGAVSLATEDGASNNKAANRILGLDQMVCTPHDIARCVLIASGEAGSVSKNLMLKEFIARSSKQSSSFHRSVIASKALSDAQLEENPLLKEHQTLRTKTKNVTRWLGLFEMCNRNRRIGKEIRIALTGDAEGDCAEAAAPVPARRAARADKESDDDSSDDGGDSGDDLEEAGRAASKAFPLAHRCMPLTDFRTSDIFESLLDRPREVTTVCQDTAEGFGEGIDLGLNHLMIEGARNEATAERVELVSGRDTEASPEVWKEHNASGLPPMFKTFRKELASQLTTRFCLDTTPSKHVLLALKMNPSIDTGPDSKQMAGKTAKFEMTEAEYTRALRRQAIRTFTANSPAPAPAPAPAETPATETPAAAAEPAAAPPGAKRRKCLLGAVALEHATVVDLTDHPHTEAPSKIDVMVKSEISKFEVLSMKMGAVVTCTAPVVVRRCALFVRIALHRTASHCTSPQHTCLRLALLWHVAGPQQQVLLRWRSVQHACVLGRP